MSMLRSKKHFNRKLQNSFNKHGEKCFKLIVLHELKEGDDWCVLEVLYIALFNTMDDRCGYNIGKGGESNMLTKEIQEKQKETNINRVPNILQINKQMEIVGKFRSANEATRITGIPFSHILCCCNLQKQSCHDYYWCYEKDHSSKWQPPLHGKVHRIIAEIGQNNEIVGVFRCKDQSVQSMRAYGKLTKNKTGSPTIDLDEKRYKFVSVNEYYDFVLNRTCRD